MSQYAYILLIREEWWNRHVAQSRKGKQVQAFVRKNAVSPVRTTLLFFYVNHPVRAIMGVGNFEERVVDEVQRLWSKYNGETVFRSHDEYVKFMSGRTKATFIRFKNLREMDPSIPLNRILKILGGSRLPRNGKYLSEETANKLK
jgi:predicted transcriptional regulator